MGTYLVRLVELGREQQARLGKQRNDLAAVIAARWPDATIETSPGRVIVDGDDGIEDELAQIAGISNVSPCVRAPRAELEAAVLDVARRALDATASFAIRVRRDRRDGGDKSLEIARALAGPIMEATGARVDLTDPDVTIGIELRGDVAYVFDRVVDGIDRTGPREPIVRPPGDPRFVADQMLGRLAARLRLLGFDTLTVFDIADSEVTRKAITDGRVLLTRDGPLSRTLAVPVLYVEATEARAQLAEVLAALGVRPDPARLFSRCTLCNATIAPVDEAAVAARLPAGVRDRGIAFLQCTACAQVYWHGSHVERILGELAASFA